MTTSLSDGSNWIVYAVCGFMLVEGILLIGTRKGLIDRLFSRHELAGRIIGGLLYFMIAGILLYSQWQR
jgi:hypothetical protein